MTPNTTTQAAPVQTGYAPVNGLNMYYEVHGAARDGDTPLVLIHGSFSAIGTSFGLLLPGLAATRQVIAIELQGHGHTADIDRPITVKHLADDVAALLEHLAIPQADLLGYSLGAAVAMRAALDYPARVRKLVLISASYENAGMHPGMMEGMAQLQPEMLVGSPFHDEYVRLAPNPDDFPVLVEKVKGMLATNVDLSPETVRSLRSPVLNIIGDSDIVQPEHAVALFRLLGGGVIGDNVGLPDSQLAILPGTTHVTAVYQADLLLAMVPKFLDAPVKA